MYALPEAVEVQITIYDVLGRQVAALVDGLQPVGQHEIIFNTNDLSTGIYFVHMRPGRFKKMRKMILLIVGCLPLGFSSDIKVSIYNFKTLNNLYWHTLRYWQTETKGRRGRNGSTPS